MSRIAKINEAEPSLHELTVSWWQWRESPCVYMTAPFLHPIKGKDTGDILILSGRL